MSKLREAFGRLSDRVHKRVNDTESRATLTRLITRVRESDEAQGVKEQLMNKAIEAAAKIIPKYDLKKTKEKGVNGMTEGTIAGAIASVAALTFANKIGVDDAQTKTLLTVAFSSLIAGLTVAIKRVYFNWQKHRRNK